MNLHLLDFACDAGKSVLDIDAIMKAMLVAVVSALCVAIVLAGSKR